MLHLFVFCECLSICNILSNKLQEKSATLGKAASYVEAVIKTFEDKRCIEEFKKLWEQKVDAFVEQNDISLAIPPSGKLH